MTIDKEQLISLLEGKTGLEREQVETQLSELISRIQMAAEEDKTFEVEGFGTFSLEEGSLQFEPGDTLETEINNKYAGMKPIELIGAFKEPESDKEVPEVDMTEVEPGTVDTENKWAFDSGATEDGKDQQETEAIESEPKLDDDEPKTEKVAGSEEIEEDQQEAEEVFDTVFGTTGDEPEEMESQQSPEPKEPAAEIEKEKQRDTIGTVIVAVVVVLVIGISGWLIYDFGFSGTGSAEVSSASPQSTETVNPTDGNTQSGEQSDQDEEDVEPEQSSAVSTGEEDTGTQPATQQQDRYGLMGEPNQAIANGYTIVVHSLRDRQQAEQNRQQLQEAGFRALISQAQVQGTTYYRVGIGQFETVSNAQQAIEDIPERFRDNNFIKRIQ